eukprot:393470-Hanusia_phi.AAC.2
MQRPQGSAGGEGVGEMQRQVRPRRQGQEGERDSAIAGRHVHQQGEPAGGAPAGDRGTSWVRAGKRDTGGVQVDGGRGGAGGEDRRADGALLLRCIHRAVRTLPSLRWDRRSRVLERDRGEEGQGEAAAGGGGDWGDEVQGGAASRPDGSRAVQHRPPARMEISFQDPPGAPRPAKRALP